MNASMCHLRHQAVIKGEEWIKSGTMCSSEWKTIPLAFISTAMFIPTGPLLMAKKAKKMFLVI